MSPNGQTLVFDLLGDLYTMPITGGTATPLTRGMAFDGQPRSSPDGKKIVFVSDRDGGWNLWTISADKRDTAQVTRGKTNNYYSPEWTPDGKYIVATRGQKLWMFHADGGSGQQLIRRSPHRALRMPPAGQAAVQPPTRARWARPSATMRATLVRAAPRQFGSTTRRWATTSSASTIARRGVAHLAHEPLGLGVPPRAVARRQAGSSTARATSTRRGIRVRDLDDRRRALARDERAARRQESRASLDVYPGMSFTPDSKAIITTWNGKSVEDADRRQRAAGDPVQGERRAGRGSRSEVRVSASGLGDVHRRSRSATRCRARMGSGWRSWRWIGCT